MLSKIPIVLRVKKSEDNRGWYIAGYECTGEDENDYRFVDYLGFIYNDSRGIIIYDAYKEYTQDILCNVEDLTKRIILLPAV